MHRKRFTAGKQPAMLRKGAKFSMGSGGGAGSWPTPAECDAYISSASGGAALTSATMAQWTAANQTLLAALYTAASTDDLRVGWRAIALLGPALQVAQRERVIARGGAGLLQFGQRLEQD